MHFMAVKLSRIHLVFVSYSPFKTVHLQQLKGMQKSKLGMWKGYHLSMGGIRRYFLCRTTGLDSGAEPPPIKLCRGPTPGRDPLFH